MNIAKLIENTEITLITRRTGKEFKVFVSWFDVETRILCGWYTDRYGEPEIKLFDMEEYDFRFYEQQAEQGGKSPRRVRICWEEI